jgi:transposase
MKTPIPVELSDDDHERLHIFLHRGRASARCLTRARILLKAAEGWTDAALTTAFDVCPNTITNVRARFRDGGVAAVLEDKRQARRRQALSDPQAAHLLAIACSPVPEGHDHWTLRLLAAKAIELGYVARLSPETVRQLMKKTCSSLGSTTSGACLR